MISFRGRHHKKVIILLCVRWYVSYALSYRDLEEMMKERGMEVDHATIQRWVINYAPQLEERFHQYKKPVGSSWRMDETYVRIKGRWCYLYRAVDKSGKTIDFLLTAKRDRKATKRFFNKAIKSSGHPDKVNIDKSGSNIAEINKGLCEQDIHIEIRQNKYLNNMIEQDHRGIKRIIRPMMGFKSFECAKKTLAGIELMRMIKKGQMEHPKGDGLSPAEQFYLLAA